MEEKRAAVEARTDKVDRIMPESLEHREADCSPANPFQFWLEHEMSEN